MRIKDDCFNTEDKARFCLDLSDLLATTSASRERPCPGCRFTFDDDRSITSTRHCSPRCPYVARQMSSEPDTHPIEAAVVPIVYAFYTMRLMMPCWSCEGHYNEQGVLAKLPKVWFYSTSHFLPKLLAQYVSRLKGNKRLCYQWNIRILPFSQSLFSTTYSLEPEHAEHHEFDLSQLQADMNTIGKNMRHNMLMDARSYLRRAKTGALH